MYGAEQVILSIGRLIDRDRFNFSLLCLNRGDGKSEQLIHRAKKLGIKVTPIAVKSRLDLSAIARIKDVILKEDIDICHSHDFKSNFYSLLSSRNIIVKLVTTAHGSTRDSFMKRIYLNIDENIIYKYYDKIIAVSEEIKNILCGNFKEQNKIIVIQNGIDKDLIDIFSSEDNFDPPLRVPEGRKVFGVIGRLYPDKGHQFLLKAFSKISQLYPDIACIIVGDGPDRMSIQHTIHELRLNHAVTLCGERKNMKEIYEIIDCLVIPSKREGLPYALLEAMIRKIPVIATKVGDIPFLIKDKISGLLVTPGDVNGLTNSLIQIIDNDQMSVEMAESGYRFVIDNFTANKMVYKTEQLYDSLISY